jgi:hypothetical protein
MGRREEGGSVRPPKVIGPVVKPAMRRVNRKDLGRLKALHESQPA